MSEVPIELGFASTHEWAKQDEEGLIVVGISDHAQDALGDIVYVEMPEVGQQILAGEEAGVVESVKAASDIYSPVSGTVEEVNERLDDSPETVNQDPYGDGWFFKLRANDDRELDELLDADAYKELCESEED
jgi:glycine cleavage system H protein|tara:strand:- start:228 stop:623 length:396 start_codon:yes stop_codon:yes gene_type:complete